MSSPVKTVAVLGCGKRSTGKEGWAVGQAHADGYLKALAGVTLLGVDPNPENLAAFGERFKLPRSQLLTSTQDLYAAHKPDIVSICTWPKLHYPMTLEAVKAGVRGIVCEKPLALDGGEVREMLAACRKANIKLAVAHQRCYEGAFITAKRLLKEGVLGDGLVIEARVGDGWDILSWSVHWLDMASWLFDSDIASVLAGVDHTGARRYQHAVENASVVLAEFAQGRQAIFVTGPDVPSNAMFTIRGSNGMMQLDKPIRLWTREGFREVPHDAIAHQGFAGLMREMADAIEKGTPIQLDAARSAKATLATFAAHESARTMKKIALPYDLGYAPLEVAEHAAKHPPLGGRAVILADAHHYEADIGRSGRDGLVEACNTLGFDSVTLIKADERSLTPADLKDADVLLIYHTQRTSTPEAREALTAWMNAGKPLAIMHCGVGAYDDWQQYKEWIGLYWVWHGPNVTNPSGHPHEPSTIDILEESFPTSWKSAWLPRDEVYISLGKASDVKMLATARLGDQTHPAAWQSVKYPNVVTWAVGHRPDIFRLDTQIDGIRAAVKLAMRNAKR